MEGSSYTLLEWAELIANFSVVGGALIIAMSIVSFRTSVQYGRAQLFLALRQNFVGINDELAREVPGFVKRDYQLAYHDMPESARSAVTHYWTNAFNEWCATTKIYKSGRGVLWRTFYANAQASALLHRPLREGLVELMRGPYSFGGFKREYHRVMLRLARRLLAGRVGAVLIEEERSAVLAFIDEMKSIKITR